MAAGSAGLLFPEIFFRQSPAKMIMRSVLSTGEKLPAIGLGSWITFDVGNTESELAPM